jgi:adenosylmethionine-8-amino-7-oxononanoate aminotransferase
MAEAATAQLRRLPFNTNWGTAHPAALQLADRLIELAPRGIERVFFTSGGSEAIEAAWKLARLYHVARGEPGRVKAIARRTAYHGLSLGALALTGIDALREPFGTPAFETIHVSNTNRYRRPDAADDNDLCRALLAEVEEAIERAGPDTVAVIAAEPIQNAGGCLTPPPGYWAGLRTLADKYGALLLADEVISGFGRVGEYFASDRYGAVPDLITIAKGVTSAYAPMGAVLATGAVTDHLYSDGAVLSHGVTFGGHPLSAAIALKNLEILERDGVLGNVRALEGHLETRLRGLLEFDIAGDVRGDGFFWAVELVGPDERPLTATEREHLLRRVAPQALRELGLIARADDRGHAVVQIAPCLISDREVLDTIVDRLGELLGRLGRELNGLSS